MTIQLRSRQTIPLLGLPSRSIMDGSIDIKLLLSLASVLVAIVTSSVIVKQKLIVIERRFDALQKDYESRLRKLDQSTDKQENLIALNQAKTAVLSDILAPSNLAKTHREVERIIGSVIAVDVTCKSNERRILKLESLHNGSHRPTTVER